MGTTFVHLERETKWTMLEALGTCCFLHEDMVKLYRLSNPSTCLAVSAPNLILANKSFENMFSKKKL
jgi:hypothetical protein